MDWARWWWTLALAALCLAGAGLLLVGWRGRARRQAGFPALPIPPALPGEPLASLTGIYVSTTTAGRWQDRIVARGLGRRAKTVLDLFDEGVLIDRVAEAPIWIPIDSFVAADTAPGVAGKVMGLADGILLLTWNWGRVAVDSGIRADDRGAQDAWLTAAAGLFARARPLAANDPQVGDSG